MNHDSVDFEEGSEIINGADEFAINPELSDSADFSISGNDDTMISNDSFEIVSKVLSPEPPVTDVEIKREYFNLRSAIDQEKKILSAKKIKKTFEIRTLEAKIDELIAENAKLKATIEDLEKALHSYSKLPLAGLHTFPKSGGKRKTKRKKKTRRR